MAVSTDYVFDGAAGPYAEDDLPNARGVYAQSKLAGEWAALSIAPDCAVARVAVVYSGRATARSTFATQVVEKLSRGEVVKAFDDQFTSTTLAASGAAMCLELLLEHAYRGVLHVSDETVMDRVDFARRVAARFGLRGEIVPVKTADVKLLAPRPLRGGLRVERAAALLRNKPTVHRPGPDRFHDRSTRSGRDGPRRDVLETAPSARQGDGRSMKTLVTGGAGFIGSNLVRHLLLQGHEVTVLDNLLSGYESNLAENPEARFIRGDVRDERALQAAADQVEVIFHLAASVGNTRSIENPIEDSEINVLGTLRVLEAARSAGTRKVVFSSSAGIFGELKTLPIREDHPVEPDSPYGASKLGAEKLCLAYAKLYPLEAVCLRYFNVYGVNQRYDAYGNVIPIFARRMIRREPLTVFGDGEQTRDFINVADVVRANFQAAMARGVSGAFNIASATAVTINELVRLMKEASGLDVEVRHGPPRKGDVRHSLADVSAARAAFGFEPTVRLDAGLLEYMAWARRTSG